jgi:NhaA family Na+:H+ antiporter
LKRLGNSFLSALAVADDPGAVLVIDFFYTAKIAFPPLAIGFGLLKLLASGNLPGQPAFKKAF